MQPPVDETDFAAAVRLLCEGSREERPSEQMIAGVSAVLRASVRRRFPPGVGIDIEDIVQDALVRFLVAARSGRLDCANSTGYLIVTARNAAIDSQRRRTASVPLDLVHEDDLTAETDPAIEAVLEADAFDSALANAAVAGDHFLVRVAATARDLLEGEGRMPSTRRLAEALGVSHTTVAQALRQLRPYFPNRDP